MIGNVHFDREMAMGYLRNTLDKFDFLCRIYDGYETTDKRIADEALEALSVAIQWLEKDEKERAIEE